MQRYLQPSRMVGVDLSKNAVEFSRAMHQVEGLEFRVGDAESLPFEPASFDPVTNVGRSVPYCCHISAISFCKPGLIGGTRQLLLGANATEAAFKFRPLASFN